MKKIYTVILLVCLLQTNAWANNGIPKYKAIIKAFPLGTVEGYIYVKLFDENKGKIRIDITGLTKQSGSFAQAGSTAEVLTAAISEFIIDTATYCFRSLHNGKKFVQGYCVRKMNSEATRFQALPNDTSSFMLMDITKEDYQTENDCLVKKVYGVDTFGIYQVGVQWNADFAVIVLPRKAIMGGCTFVSNKYFVTANVWKGILFRTCTELQQNARENKEGYSITDAMGNEEKITVWKKYIDEWIKCKSGG